ncbi:MAG: radical SAM protein [Sulfobacillus thermosulfidooxidans]|uniref:Radical SAM protein n=1 Tax=Sulfobacillus thermosulfidooxidans TaxID=28034 RepID=A0A2T2WR74_SULTH|nr:MAG: radical SAM protein [Sulfobacillus thermosulfidooxidans]
MAVREIECKSILTKSKLPDADYVINPYVGCQFGCSYCYASFMGRFNGHSIEDWGNYIYAKINAPVVLKREIRQITGTKKKILLSSVTDPYQGAEARYHLTRQSLQIFAAEQYSGPVSILTKSPLVLKDVSILRQIPDVEVGMTVTSTDDSVSRSLEGQAPVVSTRLKTLGKLHDAGIKTYAFVGPIFPHLFLRAEKLESLFQQLAEVGVSQVFAEHVNMSTYILKRLAPAIDRDPSVAEFYRTPDKLKTLTKEIDALVYDLVKKYGLQLRLNQPLHHSDLPKNT